MLSFLNSLPCHQVAERCSKVNYILALCHLAGVINKILKEEKIKTANLHKHDWWLSQQGAMSNTDQQSKNCNIAT